MSYEILRKIQIVNDKKAILTLASSNVYPRTFEDWELDVEKNNYYGTGNIYQELFFGLESGNLQFKTSNRWTQTLAEIMNRYDYQEINWRRPDFCFTEEQNEKRKKKLRELAVKFEELIKS